MELLRYSHETPTCVMMRYLERGSYIALHYGHPDGYSSFEQFVSDPRKLFESKQRFLNVPVLKTAVFFKSFRINSPITER